AAAQTAAPQAADAVAVAAPLPNPRPTHPPDPVLRPAAPAANAPAARPEPLSLPVGAGIGPATRHPSRLVEHPALRGTAMRSRRLGGARLVGLLVTVAAAAFAVMVFLPFSLPWNQNLHLQVQAARSGALNRRPCVRPGG